MTRDHSKLADLLRQPRPLGSEMQWKRAADRMAREMVRDLLEKPEQFPKTVQLMRDLETTPPVLAEDWDVACKAAVDSYCSERQLASTDGAIA